MSIKFQCERCRHILGVPDNTTGRKILCPLCGDALVIPTADPKRSFKPQSLAIAIEKYQLAEWDRAFARELSERKALDDTALHKALIALIMANRKGADLSLGVQLTQSAQISAALCTQIREQLRGAVNTETAHIECPNCFATIAANSPACRFCGQKLGGGAPIDICPACKYQQPKGHDRCRKCMADIKTGLRPNQRRCPACNKPIAGDPAACPYCKAKLHRTGARNLKGDQKYRRTRMVLTTGALILFLLVGFAGYQVLWPLIRMATQSPSRISLDQRIGKLVKLLPSLTSENAEQLKDFLDPEATLVANEETLKLLTGTDKDTPYAKIASIAIMATTLEANETAALITLRITPDAGKKGTRTVLWRWAKVQNLWYYTGSP